MNPFGVEVYTLEEMQQKADEFGYGESQQNPHLHLLLLCKKVADQGLTPLVLHNVLTGQALVTSEQAQQGEYH